MALIREHQRVQLWILILAGVFHTFDQWRRTLLPFLQWHIKPQPTFYSIGVLNSVGHFATLFGTPFAAQLIDSNGCWESALILSLITAIHAIMVSEVTDFYIFGFLQCLLAANQLPLLFDTMIGQSVADDESDKMRAQLLMQLTIPQSIAYAAGPYFAIQVIFFFTSNLSASMIGASLSFFILTALIIYFVIPRNKFTRGPQHSYLPSITAYTEMLSNQNLRWSLLFLIFVAAPYACYEQVIRVALPVHHIFEPSSFLKLFALLGLTTLIVNIFVLPHLQSRLTPQMLLKVSFAILTGSYLYLSQFKDDFTYLHIGMPIQMIGVAIAQGHLTAQIMGCVGRSNMGKAVVLSRLTQTVLYAVSPLLLGEGVYGELATVLCYISALISFIGIFVIHYYGSFLRTHHQLLPLRTHEQ